VDPSCTTKNWKLPQSYLIHQLFESTSHHLDFLLTKAHEIFCESVMEIFKFEEGKKFFTSDQEHENICKNLSLYFLHLNSIKIIIMTKSGTFHLPTGTKGEEQARPAAVQISEITECISRLACRPLCHYRSYFGSKRWER